MTTIGSYGAPGAVTGPGVQPSLRTYRGSLAAPGVTRRFTSIPAWSAWPSTAAPARTLAPHREEPGGT